MAVPVFGAIGQNISKNQGIKKGMDKLSNMTTNSGLKKSLEEKNQEKTKIYNYIGMEAYDLYKAGKLSAVGLEVYFEKMQELEQEITELEGEMAKIKNAKSKNLVCICGNPLEPDTKFCPKCGKLVEQDMITCTCGKQVKGDMAFCPNCGKNLKELNEAAQGPVENSAENLKVCICGAKIPVGQTLCMECGRKVAD